MPVVTRSKREKVWSSEKSAGEVERVEEDSDRCELDWPNIVPPDAESAIASGISESKRIQLSLSVFDGWFDSIKSWYQTLTGTCPHLLPTEGERTGHPADLDRRLRHPVTHPSSISNPT